MKRILVTGAFGQIGSELVPQLQKIHGKENVIAMGNRTIPEGFDGELVQANILESEKIESFIKEYEIDTIYHLVSLLSAKGESDPGLTWQVNMDGLKTVLDLAVKYNCKVFWPSSIAVFGPTTPRENTPQRTILEPTTMYGVTKVSGELLCQYYYNTFGLDVRSLRYPGIVSYKTLPGGGTTDYAVGIFYDGLEKGSYDCFVSKETRLPMMYMDDAVKATLEIMQASAEKIKIRTSYNLTAMSFTVEDLATEIQKHIPLDVTYSPDFRQAIADSWPASIDDSAAREDWGWSHDVDLSKMTTIMLQELRKKLEKE